MADKPQPGLIQFVCSCFLPPGYICIVQNLLIPIPHFIPEYSKDLYLFGDFSAHILQGLSFLHSFGIIHGDLKPENVMAACVHLGAFPIRPCIIDLGNSLTVSELAFIDKESHIQPVLYRAPEVCFHIFPLGYDWSFRINSTDRHVVSWMYLF